MIEVSTSILNVDEKRSYEGFLRFRSCKNRLLPHRCYGW